MAVVLGHNQYGKAENRVVRVFRDRDPHEIVDYNVSVALSGAQDPPHLTGDNSPILPTDTQKNTVFAFAKEDDAVAQPESFGIRLARHFVDNTEPIHRARVKVEMYPWARLDNPHAFVRDGRYVRTATVTYDGSTTWVVSGVEDLVVLKTTDAEFWGYIEDEYTTLEPTHDRIVATSLLSQWYHTSEDVDWGKSYDGVLQVVQDTFAGTTAWRCSTPSSRWARRRWRTSRRSPRSASPHRTSTTSSTTSAASGWRTTTRSSTPTTGPTA